MPRTRVQKNEVNDKGKIVRRRGTIIRSKFRIGGRSGGRPGHTLSTKELLEIVERGGKSANNARQVLHARGVDLTPAAPAA